MPNGERNPNDEHPNEGRAWHSVRAADSNPLAERRARSDAPYLTYNRNFVCHGTSGAGCPAREFLGSGMRQWRRLYGRFRLRPSLALGGLVPNQRMKLSWRGGRLKGKDLS